jgi:hypothetical protein
MPLTIDERIETLDDSLFRAIRSETSPDDRLALLLLQRAVRRNGRYVYLEIGSHLGGTIQPHYADPRCGLVCSIDARPAAQPDERGRIFAYPDNSTARMRRRLAEAFPGIDPSKLVAFDRDASEVRDGEIPERAALCLIDGEHTDQAVRSDFEACLRLAGANAVVAFHDACYVFRGIGQCQARLAAGAISFRGFLLPGTVYAICLREAAETMTERLAPHARNERAAFRAYGPALARARAWNAVRRGPVLGRLIDSVARRGGALPGGR